MEGASNLPRTRRGVVTDVAPVIYEQQFPFGVDGDAVGIRQPGARCGCRHPCIVDEENQELGSGMPHPNGERVSIQIPTKSTW